MRGQSITEIVIIASLGAALTTQSVAERRRHGSARAITPLNSSSESQAAQAGQSAMQGNSDEPLSQQLTKQMFSSTSAGIARGSSQDAGQKIQQDSERIRSEGKAQHEKVMEQLSQTAEQSKTIGADLIKSPESNTDYLKEFKGLIDSGKSLPTPSSSANVQTTINLINQSAQQSLESFQASFNQPSRTSTTTNTRKRGFADRLQGFGSVRTATANPLETGMNTTIEGLRQPPATPSVSNSLPSLGGGSHRGFSHSKKVQIPQSVRENAYNFPSQYFEK